MDEDNQEDKQRKQTRFSLVYFLIMLGAIWIFQNLIFPPLVTNSEEVPYSEFRQDLAQGKVAEVTLTTDRIYFLTCPPPTAGGTDATPSPSPQPTSDTLLSPDTTQSANPDCVVHNAVSVTDANLVSDLQSAGVLFGAVAPQSNFLSDLLSWVIPFLPLVVIWWLMFRRMGKGGLGGGLPFMSIGKTNARNITGELSNVHFDDVGGVDEVTVELKEIIEFLKTPDRFVRLGAKLPKGVLLVGPPGSGKTLLARATAGEAGVPFFSLSGSDFVEMFVGVGAARVRDLFKQAKEHAPCIIFIDEIDAIGQARTTVGQIGTNDEREQTLNQLLNEMDGFEANQGVVIMAATNRPEILDKALLRPGRFDRQVQVSLPTEVGRRQILAIHTRGVALGPDIELDRIAQITPGFSGADLANIVNEAALLAARRHSDFVTMNDFDLAIERVVAGLQRKMPLKEPVKRRVAYHEGGHALVADLLTHTDPVHKVSIIPTAKGALGYTLQMPEEDQYLVSETELKERLAVMLGGRSSEMLVFDELSTGASNDLEKATDLARRMVTEFGMTDSLGPVRYLTDASMGFLGIQSEVRRDLSPETARLIDEEIRRLVEDAQTTALDLLRAHRAALDEIARVLQADEVISGDAIKRIADQFT